MDEAISFNAIFEKATTTIDGGWRISFSLLQSESVNVQRLSTMRDQGLMLVVMPEDSLKQQLINSAASQAV